MAIDRQSKPPFRRLPQLNALKAFEVAARHESLMRAAAELNVTHGAISKQVRALEEDLGEPLFHRRNRGLFLTERGRQLSMSLSSVFADLENTLTDFRTHRADHPLVVSCEPTLCLKLLIPRLAEFEKEAGFKVRVLAAGGHIDFSRDHIDLAIRRNDFAVDPAIHTRVLAAEMMGVVCSPAIATEMASSKRARHPALHTRSRPDAWTQWQKKRTKMKFAGDIAYEHFYLAIEAALAGQGFAIASIHMVAADIAQGRLQAVTDFEPDGTRYIALSPREFTEGSRAMCFADWLALIMVATVESKVF